MEPDVGRGSRIGGMAAISPDLGLSLCIGTAGIAPDTGRWLGYGFALGKGPDEGGWLGAGMAAMAPVAGRSLPPVGETLGLMLNRSTYSGGGATAGPGGAEAPRSAAGLLPAPATARSSMASRSPGGSELSSGSVPVNPRLRSRPSAASLRNAGTSASSGSVFVGLGADGAGLGGGGGVADCLFALLRARASPYRAMYPDYQLPSWFEAISSHASRGTSSYTKQTDGERMLDSAASAKTNSDDPASAAIDTGSGHDVVSADFFANERPMNIDHLEFALECPALSSGRNAVLAIRGEEALGKPFEFRLWVAVASRDGWNDESLIGQPATLVTSRRTEVLRRVHGIIGEATRLARDEAGHQEYELLLVPRLSLLGVGKATEIFLDATVPEIIQAKLKRYGLSAESRSVSVRLVETYPKLEFVVQYEESDLAFISRLAEHVGIALHVVTDNDVDVVVLSDSNTTYPVESPIPFTGREMTDAVVEFSQRTCLVPGRVRVADYNYRAPKVPLEAQVDVLHGAPSIEAYEYGPHSKTPAEVARVSRLRAEEVTARRCTLIGRSHLADVAPGTVRTLEDHPLGEVPLLMTAVNHRYGQLPETRVRGDKSHGQAYENTFVAIRSSVPFRPARDTVRPRIAGVVTGVVEEDTKSHAARIDEAGRYFVEFHFAEPPDGRARICRPVRMVQSHVGPNHGIHFPLRPGSEVALAFVNGDPDRPVILGGIPNALTPSPVTAGNRSFSTIRTLTGVSIEIDDGI